MFYSHQLLSRKVPLGQIWIAATMHCKINRKKIDKIDIVEICEQILNPAVPLALRLSGILLGGVVIVFNRKVKFLYDDATKFMFHIKKDITKNSVPGADNTVLPKGKSQAKFETITINYGLDDLDDVEQLMVQNKERHQISMEEFFLIPEEESAAPLRPMMFQADHDNITLPEDNLTFENMRNGEIHRFDEDDRLVPEPENNTLPPDLNLNPEQQQDEEIPKEHQGFNVGELPQEVEQQPEAPPEGIKSPEPDAQSVQPPIRRANRRGINRKRKGNSSIFDEDFTIIPPRVYQTWLQDPSDMVKDNTRRLKIKRERARSSFSNTVEKLMRLPSTSFFATATKLSPEPCCATPLLELWNQRIHSLNTVVPPQQEEKQTQESPGTRKRRSSLLSERRDDEDRPMNFVEGEAVNEAQENINMNDDVAVAPTVPDSIEKLRARFATPNQQMDWDFSRLGLTPMPSGQSVQSNKVTPASEPLGSVKEDSAPTTKRSKRTHTTAADGLGAGLPGEENMMGEIGTPLLRVVSDQKINVSQFNLMVETGPSQPILYQTPKESMDHLTGRILNHFRDHFTTPGVPPKQSLNQLTLGMDRRQAARLFYQTCVLASNKYVKVDQEEAYGDIMIQRGPYL